MRPSRLHGSLRPDMQLLQQQIQRWWSSRDSTLGCDLPSQHASTKCSRKQTVNIMLKPNVASRPRPSGQQHIDLARHWLRHWDSLPWRSDIARLRNRHSTEAEFVLFIYYKKIVQNMHSLNQCRQIQSINNFTALAFLSLLIQHYKIMKFSVYGTFNVDFILFPLFSLFLFFFFILSHRPIITTGLSVLLSV